MPVIKNKLLTFSLNRATFILVLTLVFLLGGHVCIRKAQAAVTLVQKGGPGAGIGTTSVSAFFTVIPTQNNLLIAIVSNKNSSSPPTTPAGWSVAISETTNSPGQVIYYKIAGASEPTNVTVSGYDAANWLIMCLYEYSGIDTSSPLDQTGSSSGTGSSVSSGSVTTTQGVELLIAALVINNSASFSGWTNSFTEQNDWALNDGANRVTSGQADRYVANLGTYSTTATASKSDDWRGQIVTFRAVAECPGGVVTTTADSGTGSLRECILFANNNPGTTITFNIPGPGNQSSGPDSWWRISPTSALPTIGSNGTMIDATTQTANQGDTNSSGPEIEIDGNGAAFNGLTVISANNTIKGLIIGGFSRGIWLSGASATGNTVSGNYIGTNFDGTVANGNSNGVYVSGGTQSNTIGGTTASERNIISGNGTGIYIQGSSTSFNIVKGNYIGTKANGLEGLGNNNGIFISSGANSNTIGGTSENERNIISGSLSVYGVRINGSNFNKVLGNFIGTDVTGMADLGNNQYGVFLYGGSQSNTIGGSVDGARNIISGNNLDGVFIQAPSTNANVVQGNYIGTDITGTGALPNTRSGVLIAAGAQLNIIGGTGTNEANTVAFNTGDGIAVSSSGETTVGNQFSANTIFSNGDLGIDLGFNGVGTGDGANNDKPAPTISSITPSGSNYTVIAAVTSGDTIEFFRVNNAASPAVSPDGTGYGEGYLFLGSCVDNGTCTGPHISAVADADPVAGTVQATLLSGVLSRGDTLSATATDATNGTSEFAANILVVISPDVAIDCDFSDWCNDAGTEYCIDDEGGQDDFSNPTKLDITRFAFESNLNDRFHVLFGFDDVPPQDTTSATLIDTDLDHNIDFALVANLVDGSTSIVELYSCDDTISNGCSGAVLSKTYNSGDFCAGSGSGPWNNDSFLETTLPYSDLGFVSGEIAIVTMVSYAARSLLTSPKDSVFGTSEENYDARIIYDTTGGTGDESPTAVNLLSFTATGQGSAVLAEWQTAQEINNAGFYLERATSPHGPFVRITDKLIPGLFSSVKGKQYTYEDTNVTAGKLYYYRLEEMDIFGTKTLHGPICVDWDGDGMADDWEIAHGLDPTVDDSMLDLDGDGLTNLEEYEFGTDPLNPDTDGDGIPDGEESRKRDPGEITVGRTLTQGVQIIESDAEGITLELRTDALSTETVEVETEIYQRLRIVDYIHGFTKEVGKPELPLKGIFLDLPEGSSATLKVVDNEVQSHSDYWVYPVPEKVSRGEGDLAHVAELFAKDGEAYSSDGWYPQPLAELGESYTFRDRQKLQIIFYPLAFNPVTRELVQYKRIRVRLNYEVAPEQPFLNESLMATRSASSVQSASSWIPPSTGPAYKLFTADEGIYRLSKSWLEANGVEVSGIDLSQVRLYNLGQEVAIHVSDGGVPDQFEDGDSIEFYATPVGNQYGKYAKNNVYWLTTSGGGGAPKRMENVGTTPGSGTLAGTHSFTVHHEEDQWYLLGIPGGDSLERWSFYPFVDGDGIEDGGNPVDFTLTLPGVSGHGSVKIQMVGTYDTDHEVEVSLSDAPQGPFTSLGTYTWSGLVFHQVSIDPVNFVPGDNYLRIRCNSGVDSIAVDWIEATYPRSFAASNETLKFFHEAGYRFQVTGFTDNDLGIFDITSASEVQRLYNFQVSPTSPYSVDFEPTETGARSYLVVSSTAVKTPVRIAQDSPASLADPANGADYILITHRDLGWDGSGDPLPWLDDLVSLREDQGLRVQVVDVADILDEFSYGIFAPQAVKDFLTYAYENWSKPAPQYVLFLGDSTYDPKGNWNWMMADTTTTYLPTYLTATKYMGETLTDEWFARVSGNDAVPDLYMGRLPAASAAEAEVMVNKIITYENGVNSKSWEKNVLLVADNQIEDYEAVFEQMNEDAASLLPAGMNTPFRGYLDDYFVPGDLTAEIKGKVDEGALVLNYSGHGSTQVWANEQIFDADDVADLANDQKLPFLVSMSCLTGYFGYPESWSFPSLGEAMLRSAGKGALAALMPTGMTAPEGQHVLDTALFEAIFTEDVRTLGPAISAAKQTLLANGSSEFEDVSETFLLFGDPAMRLKVPLPTRPAGVVLEGSVGGITLSWQEATDCNGNDVAGYNIYRSTSPGGSYEKVNDSLVTGTQYVDTSVGSRPPYYYVVTSVDTDGDESVQSQEASATVGTSSSGGGGGGGGCFINTAADLRM